MTSPNLPVLDSQASTANRGRVRASERGAVLIVGLVMLAVMTLLVVSMIKTSVVELKIGGATQIAQQNMTNAERMINTFIDVNNGRFAANYLPLFGSPSGPVLPPTGVLGSPPYDATTGVYTVSPIDVHHGRANLQVREIHCAPDDVIGRSRGALFAVHFDIRSTATGLLGGSSSVHQGIKSTVPSGSC
jgi:hypothetical protein